MFIQFTNNPLKYPYNHPSIHLFMHLCIHSFICPSTQSSINPSICTCMNSFSNPSIHHTVIYSSIHTETIIHLSIVLHNQPTNLPTNQTPSVHLSCHQQSIHPSLCNTVFTTTICSPLCLILTGRGDDQRLHREDSTTLLCRE